MPIKTAVWRIGSRPEQLLESSLVREQVLEDMIVADPRILSEEWMLIGRQEDTGMGGRVDLLALAPNSSLVLIELKRDRTPRDVVAQALDYACWVEGLPTGRIYDIYSRFSGGRSLQEDFRTRFEQELDEGPLNKSHQIIIVASSLDDSTERIVRYLSQRNIPINVLSFQVFSHGDDQLLSRAWLLDPVHTEISAAATSDGQDEPWNGEFYCNFGAGENRSWDDAVKYGFVSAGGGAFYSRTLRLLAKGDRVWVKVPGSGFVGVGRVLGQTEPAATFRVRTSEGERLALDVLKGGNYHKQFRDDPERQEYFVPVRWIETVPLDKAVGGMFGNQNTVCRPTDRKWRDTVDRLKERFPKFDRAEDTAAAA